MDNGGVRAVYCLVYYEQVLFRSFYVLMNHSLPMNMLMQDEKASFKKVKKKSRKIRKKEVLKADDLLPLPDNAAVDTSRYAFL